MAKHIDWSTILFLLKAPCTISEFTSTTIQAYIRTGLLCTGGKDRTLRHVEVLHAKLPPPTCRRERQGRKIPPPAAPFPPEPSRSVAAGSNLLLLLLLPSAAPPPSPPTLPQPQLEHLPPARPRPPPSPAPVRFLATAWRLGWPASRTVDPTDSPPFGQLGG